MSGKCIARKWKGENGKDGIGSRCNRPCKIGEFCGIHGKKIKNTKLCKEPKCSKYKQIHIYAWEHLGRCDEVIPDFFTQPKNKLSKEEPKNKLSKEYLDKATPSQLHEFKFLNEKSIGEIPKRYNMLVGIDEITKENARAIHYTEGGPWFDEYKDAELSEEWWEVYKTL